jgi:hypothetical protein
MSPLNARRSPPVAHCLAIAIRTCPPREDQGVVILLGPGVELSPAARAAS